MDFAKSKDPTSILPPFASGEDAVLFLEKVFSSPEFLADYGSLKNVFFIVLLLEGANAHVVRNFLSRASKMSSSGALLCFATKKLEYH